MARFTLDVPDSRLARVVTAFCVTFGYQPQVQGEDGTLVPNPETPQQFTRRKLVEHARAVVVAHEAAAAGEVAREAAAAKAEAEITVT